MKVHIPQLRKLYKTQFIFRLFVLAFTIIMYFTYPKSFTVMEGLNFFNKLSWLHILWVIWVIDVFHKFIPTRKYISLGSVKHLKEFYKPIRKLFDKTELLNLIKKGRFDALKVMVIWIGIIIIIGVLQANRLLKLKDLLLISVIFYVLDLMFVLFWCPFRVWILRNRCCTTCRIFNWDHMMMFSPLLFSPGFFSFSLFFLGILELIIWELCFFLHPERFFEETNAELRCNNCIDKLCGNKNCKL